jgi:hypothetical protein
MNKPIAAVRCTHVVAQVSLGFYDAEGHLVGEETFPQGEGSVLVAKLFHPHPQQLAGLIETCVQQAWQKLNAPPPAAEGPPPGDAPALRDGATPADLRVGGGR